MKLDVKHPSETCRRRRSAWLACALALLALTMPAVATAQTVLTPFDQEYVLVDLGPVPNVPTGYGGLAPYPFNEDTFVLAGAAGTANGRLYMFEVTRDASGHVNGFTQTYPYWGASGAGAALADGPAHSAFYTSLANDLVQVTTRGDRKSTPLAWFVNAAVGGIAFVPQGQGGAGKLKFATRQEGLWGTLDLQPDGMGLGTYNVVGAALSSYLGENIAAVTYVPPGAPAFPNPSVLVTEPTPQKIATYEVDANGDPIPATRQEVVLGFERPTGVTADPVTGDFLLSDSDGRIFLLRPPTPAECAPAPLATCAVPGKASISFSVSPKDQRKRKMTWRWMKGSATPSAFGNPIDGTTNYRLCVYDDDVLRIGLAVPTGGTCDGKPCWKGTPIGRKYKSKEGNEDGVTQLKLQAGAGNASILLQGKGHSLPSPFPISDTASVTVQLVKNSGQGPECWGVRFPRPARSNPLKNQFSDSVP